MIAELVAKQPVGLAGGCLSKKVSLENEIPDAAKK
jgi:hypothetical protein